MRPKVLLILLYFASSVSFVWAEKPKRLQKSELDSLLCVLDTTIRQKSGYSQKKDSVITELNKRMQTTTGDHELYQIYRALLGQYWAYNIDSAMHIAQKRWELAQRLYPQREINTSLMRMASLMCISGMYKETLDILNSIPYNTIEPGQFSHYYHLYHSIYNMMSEYAFEKNLKDKYHRFEMQYKDSLLLTLEPASLAYQMVKAEQLLAEGNGEQARIVMEAVYEQQEEELDKNPVLASVFSDLYLSENDTVSAKIFLTMAAIADIRTTNREYAALQRLAAILYREGELDRAHAYIQCAMEDAIAGKATFRTLEIAEILPLIVSSYNLKMQNEKAKLYRQLIIIALLSLLLAMALLFIYVQLLKIRRTRESIKQINRELQIVNDHLKELNEDLLDSNHVKEEYIGYVFNICSSYIEKMKAYRKNINLKARLNQVDEIVRLTNSYLLETNELKEFFHTFDSLFIKLYPNFIAELNTMLLKDKSIIPKEDEILSPELRIFALIKLGITDNAQIAKFLGYSVQTVYNYRLKMRNKMRLPKEDFMLALKKIGINH
ncbi:hypothetical protein FACS189413_13260 [Bacteroidia bacterium]|nr:hypothetical protein FACS189413_13260 [Bacteroidia bacterium]